MWVRDIKIGAHVDLTDKTTLVLLRYYCTMALKADGAGVYRFTPKKLAYDAGYSVARWDEADTHRVYDALRAIAHKTSSGEWDFITQVNIYMPDETELFADKEAQKINGKAVFYAECIERPWKTSTHRRGGFNESIEDSYIWVDSRALAKFLETCKERPRNSDSKFMMFLAVSKGASYPFVYVASDKASKNSLFVRGGKMSHSMLWKLTHLSQPTITRYIKWFTDMGIFLYQQGYMIPGGPWDQSYFVMTNIPVVRDLYVKEFLMLENNGKLGKQSEYKRQLPDEMSIYTDAYISIAYPWRKNLMKG